MRFPDILKGGLGKLTEIYNDIKPAVEQIAGGLKAEVNKKVQVLLGHQSAEAEPNSEDSEATDMYEDQETEIPEGASVKTYIDLYESGRLSASELRVSVPYKEREELYFGLLERGLGQIVDRDAVFKVNQGLVQNLFEIGKGNMLLHSAYSDTFSSLRRNKELAEQLIKSGYGPHVMWCIDKFEEGFEYNAETRRMLLEHNDFIVDPDTIMKYKNKEITLVDVFRQTPTHLHKDLLMQLFEITDPFNVTFELGEVLEAENDDEKTVYDFLGGIEIDKQTALKMIDLGGAPEVCHWAESLPNVRFDKEVADRIYCCGDGGAVFRYVEIFEGVERNNEMALELIRTGSADLVSCNLKEFGDLDAQVLVGILHHTYENNLARIVQDEAFFDYFPNLDDEVALTLIAIGKDKIVRLNKEKFVGLKFDMDFVNKLFERESHTLFILHNDLFEGVDLDKAMALRLLETKTGGFDVVTYAGRFVGLDDEVFLKCAKRYEHFALRAQAIKHFNGLGLTAANLFIMEKEGSVVADNITNFPAILSEYGVELTDEEGENVTALNPMVKDLLIGNHFIFLSGQQVDIDRAKAEEYEQKRVNCLHLEDVNLLAGMNSLDAANLSTEKGARQVFESLTSDDSADANDEKAVQIRRNREQIGWGDEQLVAKFKQGAEVFGYKRMFEYYGEAPNLHDAVIFFDEIIEMYNSSGLKPGVFFNNILKQVSMDTGLHEGHMKSQHKLSLIAKEFRSDFEEVFAEASKYSEIVEMQELLDKIGSPARIFKSWRMLLQYSEICYLVEKVELLDALKVEENRKLYRYITRLLFHPAIKYSHSVRMFYTNPYKFFGLASSATPQETHNSKKTQNYVDIPNLDLSPKELRDALVEGALDEIQVWEAQETEYTVPEDESDYDLYAKMLQQDVQSLLRKAFGYKGQEGDIYSGEKRLVAKRILEHLPAGMKVKDLIIGNPAIPEETANIIRNILFTTVYGGKLARYRMKINQKSDPDGVIAGNETQNCMPFGDGKNTLYTYNPICALMTLQRLTNEHGFRTIAQSVLTKDKDIGVNISKLLGQFAKEESLADLVPEDVLQQKDSVIACDSIEVNLNYREKRYNRLLTDIYVDFLCAYAKRFGERDGLEAGKAVVGNCGLAGSLEAENTYIPEAPVAYSDKYSKTVMVLPLEESQAPYWTKKTIVKQKNKAQEAVIDNPNVQYLTFQDTLETAYIEGKAYSNQSLQEGLHQMENSLIAKDINNAAKGRPNMSLKYVDEKGRMGGYMLAYHGKVNKEGEEVLYVQDLARLPEAQDAGGALLDTFMDLYKRNYIDNGSVIPIVAETREVTSYKVLKRRLDELGKAVGVVFVLEEGTPDVVGNDVMIPITLRPEQVNG